MDPLDLKMNIHLLLEPNSLKNSRFSEWDYMGSPENINAYAEGYFNELTRQLKESDLNQDPYNKQFEMSQLQPQYLEHKPSDKDPMTLTLVFESSGSINP